MAISGQANINIGNINSPIGSDTLYNAFHTIQNNFTTLFSVASPISSITGANGVSVATFSNGASTDYRIENTGVTQLVAGQNITISNVSGGASGNGILVISATGGGGNASGVTSVGVTPVSNTRLVVTNTPIVSSGNIGIDLAAVSGVAGNYTNPNVTIDGYGRVTSVSNGLFNGVTSVGLAAGDGISIAGGPITSNGTITVTNTGVTSLVAGVGIDVSSSNGVVTITNTGGSNGGGGGTVTRVGVVAGSNNITVSGSPIVSSGNIIVNLASNISANVVTANSFTVASGSNTVSQFSSTFNGIGSGDNNWFSGRRSRGTTSAPTAVVAGDRINRLQSYAYTSFGAYQPGAALTMNISELPASNASLVPSSITLESVGEGNVIYPLALNNYGNVRIPGTIYNTVYSNTAVINTNFSTRARGNITNPSPLQAGDSLYRMQFYGYTGNGTATIWNTDNYSYGGGIDSFVVEVPSSNGEWISSNINIRTVSTSNTVLTSTFTNTGNLVIPVEVQANTFSGNGSKLTNINGANVTGQVSFAAVANSVAGANVSGAVQFATTANAVAGANVSGAVQFATTANSVAGANVSGTVANATRAGTVTTAAQPNITSVGVLSSLSVTGTISTTANLSAGNISATSANIGGAILTGTYIAGKLITTSGAPLTATSAGAAGQISYSNGYIYICVATNTWRRAALSAW